MNAPGAFPSTPRSDILSPAQYYGTVGEVVRARKDEYLVKKTIKIKVGTWNTASLHGTEKDLGGWFVKGLGVKGLTQDLAGLHTYDSTSDGSDTEIESVEEQEAHVRKKKSTLPKHDVPGIAGGDEVDLYVLGLQEVVDIASMTEAIKPYTDPNPAKKWKKEVRQALPNGYKKVVEQQLLGLLLLVFASPQLKNRITSVSSTGVGTGLMGYMGNKGAVSARVVIDGATRMTFVNCHLAAGTDPTALVRRIWDTNQILARTRFAPVGDECVTGPRQHESIGDEDYCFWFGDLNYRLDSIPGEDVRRLLLLHTRNEYDVSNKSKRRIDSELGFIEAPSRDSLAQTAPYEESEVERPATVSSAEPLLDPIHDPASLITTLKSLLQHDQLKGQQRDGKVFHEGWREGEINFLPTYKYDIGSVAMFDSGEKKRSPSWCDRILFRSRRDYERYQSEVQVQWEARKRDEDMRKRGLYDAVHQEEVLFTYDPAKDEAYDEDQDSYRNSQDAAKLAQHLEQAVDDPKVEEYISHQRVLSSDHKPLSALFSVTYDSVDQDLKMRVQQDVTREFDRAENEARPSITLVLDHASPSRANADKSPESPDIDIVEFGDVRYDVRCERQITVANTGPIDAVFAMLDEPSEGMQNTTAKTFPEWLAVSVCHTSNLDKVALSELGSATGYKLQPGESTSIDLVVHIHSGSLVQELNRGALCLDEILVLRVLGGRDFFIPVRGTWLQTCFYRSVSELIRIPSGACKLTIKEGGSVVQQQPPPTMQHSAPPELFALTDILPDLVIHAVAEWNMLHQDEDRKTAPPPWQTDPSWPFRRRVLRDEEGDDDSEGLKHRIEAICEALDSATDLQEPLREIPTASQRLVSICTVLIAFLASLTDSIIPATAWQQIESQISSLESLGATTPLPPQDVQDLVQEALTDTATPAHSVSLTFITFTLSRILNTLDAETTNTDSQLLDPPASAHSTHSRSRSSTSASQISESSLPDPTDTKSKSAPKSTWLPSLRRAAPPSTQPTTFSPAPTYPNNKLPNPIAKHHRTTAYAALFAPILIAPKTQPYRRTTAKLDADKADVKSRSDTERDRSRKERVVEGLLALS